MLQPRAYPRAADQLTCGIKTLAHRKLRLLQRRAELKRRDTQYIRNQEQQDPRKLQGSAGPEGAAIVQTAEYITTNGFRSWRGYQI
ncbi:hypothetical protein N7471_002710 [Penicillium samsonianum]|uniref:uncharacterized protein n=1 Tax=Penicillium samsonianum TaxID=1882272 RepID=UPI00254985FD|nr:uncharacterized protein N7471_002710 [Penicillium samsonianum]KAJ6143257.1 hypothetical protein N7471_002710 [Penicillium samsonianum]